MKLRLIVKRPGSKQTGPDSFQDTTDYVTAVVDCPESLQRALSLNEGAVIGAEVIRDQL